MRKILISGEFREMASRVICIALSVAICLMCILMQNIWAVVTSLALIVILCVGLGYAYCKNEPRLTELFEENSMADVEVPNYERAEKVEEKSFESVDNEE